MRKLNFHEAVELYRGRFQIGLGLAEAAVWQAIASREVHCAWTEKAIVNQSRQASAPAGNSTHLAALRTAAHNRAKWRLRLLTEVESTAFKDEIIAGNIVLAETDLLSWYSRERSPATAPAKAAPAPRASKKQIDEIVKHYHRSLPPRENPSLAALEQFAEDNGVTGHRNELREADNRLFGRRRVGRPKK
jgi:hypothetical protein